MKNYITTFVSFLLGGLVALLLMYYGYFQYCKSNWEHQGYNSGYLKAQFDIYNKIKDEFGEVNYKENSKIFFTAKDMSVVAITKDGVETIRAVK